MAATLNKCFVADTSKINFISLYLFLQKTFPCLRVETLVVITSKIESRKFFTLQKVFVKLGEKMAQSKYVGGKFPL